MYTINPLTKTLVITVNVETADIRAALQDTWNSFQMLNILILSYDTLDNKTLVLNTFNPFTNQHLALQVDYDTIDTSMAMILDFMNTRLKNLNEYPIKVTIFEDFGICKEVTPANSVRKRYTYQDGETMELISKVMNFYPNYTTNPDEQLFGIRKNGTDTFSGAMQDLFTGAGEVAANARIITNVHRTNFFIYLNWCITLNLNFVVPARYYEYNFDVFPHSFYDKWIMLLMCFTFVIITMMSYAAQHFDYYMLDEKDVVPFSLIRITLNVMSLLHNIQLMIFPKSNQLKQCIIFGSFLLITLNINSVYQGNIITQLNSKPQFGEINSIEQMLDTDLNVYVIENLFVFMEPYKYFEEGTLYRRMYDRPTTEVNDLLDQLKLTSVNRTAAFLTCEIYIPTFMAESFENGVNRIHEIKETPMKYFSALTISKKSPYIERFNEVIDLIVASGIVKYQTDKAKNERDLVFIRKIKKDGVEVLHLKLLGMKELRSLFYCYILLCCLAVVVFALELLLVQQVKKSHFWKNIEDWLESNHV